MLLVADRAVACCTPQMLIELAPQKEPSLLSDIIVITQSDGILDYIPITPNERVKSER